MQLAYYDGFSACVLQRRQCSLWICFLDAFGKSRVFFPQRADMALSYFFYDLRYISPGNRCGTAHLGSQGLLSACFLRLPPLRVHFQGIAMMRALKGGICQRIKNFEKHLRVKCNYGDRDMGNVRLRSSNGGEKSEEVSFPPTTFMSLWQREKVQRLYLLAYKHCIHFLHICFVFAICKSGYYI